MTRRITPLSFMTRREILGVLGLSVLACTTQSSNTPDAAGTPDADPSAPDAAVSGCLAVTETTRGPYFADDRSDPNISGDFVDVNIPERSDIRTDTEGSAGAQAGLPLVLTILVGSGNACAPIANAQVHIWHCNAQGAYSDFNAGGNGNHSGQTFLRGYQWTDADGKVTFTTIYPGWYTGRTVHIHVKVRVFDANGNVTTESTSQLLFDDNVSNAVYAAGGAYARSGTRDQTNATDGIASSEHPSLLVPVSGSPTTSYTGTIALAVTLGQIHGG